MKRYAFLDWLRGLAILIMIQCHTFNSFARPDTHETGAYVFSQFIGGMAAPLFLFMAGMTLAFQMESLDRREPVLWKRCLVSLRRAGYVLAVAFAFRFSNYIASLPRADTGEIIKVDILNTMGVALAAFSVAAFFPGAARARFGIWTGICIAALSPVMANLSWNGVPQLLREYLVPIPGAGHFPFFPCASYVGFGLAAGTIVKLTAHDRLDRLMQWSVLLGFALIFLGQYFSNLPYSLYQRSNFWTDSPALVFIRGGVSLALMAAAYLWTGYWAAAGVSWIQTLGQNSLMVYWVHVMLVYGDIFKPLKRALSVPQTALASAVVALLMFLLSIAWLRWKAWRAGRWRSGATAAQSSSEPANVS